MVDGDIVITGHPVERDRIVEQGPDSLYFGDLVVVFAFIDHVAAHHDERRFQPVGVFDGPGEERGFGGEPLELRGLTNKQSAFGEGRDFFIRLAARTGEHTELGIGQLHEGKIGCQLNSDLLVGGVVIALVNLLEGRIPAQFDECVALLDALDRCAFQA